MNTLNTTDDVIDALGGTSAVARLLGVSPPVVHNWRGRVRGRFPAETYVVLTAALKDIGTSAPDRLWGMYSAAAQKAVA